MYKDKKLSGKLIATHDKVVLFIFLKLRVCKNY